VNRTSVGQGHAADFLCASPIPARDHSARYLASVMGRLLSSPLSDHPAAGIWLLSVVNPMIATSCDQTRAGEPISIT
jgi:hypothetical protein